MTTRQVYSSSGTVACLLLAVAGVAMPLSDLARLTRRYDAAASLEAAAAACIVVAILGVCFWFGALRQLKAGAPITGRRRSRRHLDPSGNARSTGDHTRSGGKCHQWAAHHRDEW
jgi:hypothetical protein